MTPTLFASAEEAWFWTCSALRARREGASCDGSATPRPCDPDDVLKCLDNLYRRRRIDLNHAQVLRFWGERRQSPDALNKRQKGAASLWREAMDRLAEPLRAKGIIQ